QPLDRGGVGLVGLEGRGAYALAAEFLDERLGPLGRGRVADGNVRAVAGEVLRDGGPDAARTAGDQGDLPRGVLRHDLLPRANKLGAGLDAARGAGIHDQYTRAPFSTGRSIAKSATPPGVSTPSTRHWLSTPATRRGGKFTTATTCRPINWSG